MSIQIHATYRGGVIHPDRPLELPENTEIDLTVIPANGQKTLLENNVRMIRPSAPSFSAEELSSRLQRHAVSAASLPADFSRADIYQDHD